MFWSSLWSLVAGARAITRTLAVKARVPVQCEKFPPGTEPFKPDEGHEVRVGRLLLEAGILTTPAIRAWPLRPFWDPRTWHALFKYADLLRVEDDRLYLDPAFEEMDERWRGLLAEEVAIGFAACLLRDRFDVVHIADVKGLLPRARKGRRADYACGVRSGGWIVAEVKGTGTRTGRLPMADAKTQATAIPASVTGGGTTARQNFGIGLALGVAGRTDTIAKLRDPPPDGGEVSPDDLAAVAYGKVLTAAGLDARATALAGPVPWEGLDEEEPVATVRAGDRDVIVPAWTKWRPEDLPGPHFEEGWFLREWVRWTRGRWRVPILGLDADVLDALPGARRGLAERVAKALPKPRAREAADEERGAEIGPQGKWLRLNNGATLVTLSPDGNG